MMSTIGMASLLFLVIYGPGPAWEPGKPTREQPLQEHGSYMLDLYEQGVLREAGGFADADGGAAVIHAADERQARAMLDADPVIERGVMTYTLRQWAPQDWQAIGERRRARRAQQASAPAPQD
ncbi:YciI family protein [Luteimonas sp. RD2P54]|uniref:YciI family protein n=1 Tax=Luteimonas endophytica TaxID=3042023 RepID=A0ABT6JD02_9GAMM|nr:YciI family protein [Luteimonas endophytica]MDH5824497.1 YciI family protein [Luteimonas endophytica]